MFWGDKSIAVFDIWSIEHLIMGVVLSYVIDKINSDRKTNLLILLLMSFFWECVEHYLEEGLLGVKIQNWLAGIEFWGNRLIGDNLLMILGYLIYEKHPKSIFFALVFSGIFLILHLCCSSSMDIQKIFF